MSPRLRLGALWLGATVLGLFLPVVLTSGFHLGLLINGLLLGIAAIGIGFLMHQCGLVMFGVAAFIGLPAYLLGIFTTHWGLPLGAAAPLALLGSTLFAVASGALVVRARPLPFAMLTLALAQMLKSATTLQAVRPITGGDDGLSMTFSGTLFGLGQSQLAKAASFWPLAWIALCLVVLIAWNAKHSRFGQVLRATQANEERMRFSGFDTYWPRLAGFVLASFIVSVSGLLMALNSAFASPELLDFATGGHALVAMLVGGGATVGGPLLGALLYTWGQDAFGATGYLELLTGIAVVVMIAAFPQGAMGAVLRLFGKR
ncbi:MAG: branched-chain amino acid ABC transporter permease [Rubrivivax sp.]|nr:branched-chain amino acid ABC transporter permease [Rubrivivax sp.]MCL4697634.1 branched-chain amino acid ABC transporter permease [Burkholderiaceae bacterium]